MRNNHIIIFLIRIRIRLDYNFKNVIPIYYSINDLIIIIIICAMKLLNSGFNLFN